MCLQFFCVFYRESGKERLIRIVKDNGRYGFNKDSIRFRSLKELIEYHQVHPIVNRDLIIKLLYPYGNLPAEACDKWMRESIQELTK